MFQYFVWPVIFLFAAVTYLVRLRALLLSSFSFILAVWFFVSALQRYYQIISPPVVISIGLILEGLGILICFMIFLSKES